jgi:hypothetical protein
MRGFPIIYLFMQKYERAAVIGVIVANKITGESKNNAS